MFGEFVEYILRENDGGKVLNEHWIPVYKFCNPCQVIFFELIAFALIQIEWKYAPLNANMNSTCFY